MTPKKWHEVYPIGTKEGDEEAKVFKFLARQKWDFQSISSIVNSTKLPRLRVEEIIEKYATCCPPLIYPHESNEDSWGYWERCPQSVPKKPITIGQFDADKRIKQKISRLN